MSIVSKYEFERKYPILDEACRQWYAFIQEDPSRADGEGFGQFYEELSSLKYEEYRQHPEAFDMQRTDYPSANRMRRFCPAICSIMCTA